LVARKETYCLTGSADLFVHWLQERTQSDCPRQFPLPCAEGYYTLQPVRLPAHEIGQQRLVLEMPGVSAPAGGNEAFHPQERCAIRFKIVPLAPRQIEVSAECDEYLVLDYFDKLCQGIGWAFPAQPGGGDAQTTRATTEKMEAIRSRMGYRSSLELAVETTLHELSRCLSEFHQTLSGTEWEWDTAPTIGKTLSSKLGIHTDGVSCLGHQIWYVRALDVPSESEDELGTPFCIISASRAPEWSSKQGNVLHVNCWPDWNQGKTPRSYQRYLKALLKELQRHGFIKDLPTWLVGPDEKSEKPWMRIPDIGYDRRLIELLHAGYTSREIGAELKRTPHTIENRIAALRKIHGEEIVPRRRTMRKSG